MKTPIHFIIIDDDSTNNFICSIVIEDAAPGSPISAFELAEKGLEYIKREYSTTINPTILFLDINMPTCSGWDFLEHFEKFDEKIKNQFKIFVLSSSLDPADQQRASENTGVTGYIEKPLSEEMVLSIMKINPPILIDK